MSSFYDLESPTSIILQALDLLREYFNEANEQFAKKFIEDLDGSFEAMVFNPWENEIMAPNQLEQKDQRWSRFLLGLRAFLQGLIEAGGEETVSALVDRKLNQELTHLPNSKKEALRKASENLERTAFDRLVRSGSENELWNYAKALCEHPTQLAAQLAALAAEATRIRQSTSDTFDESGENRLEYVADALLKIRKAAAAERAKELILAPRERWSESAVHAAADLLKNPDRVNDLCKRIKEGHQRRTVMAKASKQAALEIEGVALGPFSKLYQTLQMAEDVKEIEL